MDTSKKLIKRTCFNHEARESVALCQICRQTFCRECITLVDESMTCSACASSHIEEPIEKKKKSSFLTLFALVVVGSFAGFALFYFLAEFLVDLPDKFHDGSYF